MRSGIIAVTAAALLVGIQLSGVPQKKPAMPKTGGSSVAKGKEIAAQKKCGSCHGANLKGKPGGAPNITWAGELKDYSEKAFERSMDLGVNEGGKKLKPPMPAYHMGAKDADSLYAYLKSLK
jgi:mono/diheme cytochrome c family protein